MKAAADSTAVPVVMAGVDDRAALAGVLDSEAADVPEAIADRGPDLAPAPGAPEVLVDPAAPAQALPDFAGIRPRPRPEAADAAPAGMTAVTHRPNR